MRHTRRSLLLASITLLTVLAPLSNARAQAPDHTFSHVVVPPLHGFSMRPAEQSLEVIGVHADVEIIGRTARTVLDIQVRNPGRRIAEAVILQPLPRGAAISSFAFEGPASEPTARLLPRGEARRIYDSIVRQVRDPAILEFAGYDLVRSSVFPVQPGGTQRVRLGWDTVLGGDGNRIDYLLPRSDSLASNVPFTANVQIQSGIPIGSIYSPSHELTITSSDDRTATVSIGSSSSPEPGAFRLSILQDGDQIPASIFAYPDPTIGGGYFLLVAGAPDRSQNPDEWIPHEVQLVLDRSGSMAGDKMDQVKAAALQILESLDPRDSFNIIDYGTTVTSLFDEPRAVDFTPSHAARQYLSELRPNGGTNIHDALLEALRADNCNLGPPIVLFLTDGMPTVGRTSERDIKELVDSGNSYGRRIFTFGVGTDVNAPLLDRIADISRGYTTYVLPGEDVEVAVAGVARRLSGPTLTNVEFSGARNMHTGTPVSAIHDVLPAVMPDLYSGDQLVVLGTYRGEDQLEFRLSGMHRGSKIEQTHTFDVSKASTKNNFVPRLWAARQINFLADEIRQAGPSLTLTHDASGRPVLSDPRFQELVDEIVRLSTRFGILTEYTAFLAEEGTNLGSWSDLVTNCTVTLEHRAISPRSGRAAVNQGINFNATKQQAILNPRNQYIAEDLKQVEYGTVQQVADCAMFRQTDTWVDSRLVVPDTQLVPDETVQYGTDRHLELVHAFASEGRQAMLSLDGSILIEHEGRVILVNNS